MTTTTTLLKSVVGAPLRALRSLTTLPSLVHQALLGQLLGDGHAGRSSPTSNTRIEWSFGQPYVDYASWINALFAAYCGTPVKALPSGQLRFKTLSLPVFNWYHDLFYVPVGAGWVKVVPATIDALMTPVVLAHLIMSDGSFDATNGEVLVFVNAYTRDDCLRLAKAITAMGVKTTVRVDRHGANGAKQYKLAIVKGQLPALRALVVPHTHKTMLYRLGL